MEIATLIGQGQHFEEAFYRMVHNEVAPASTGSAVALRKRFEKWRDVAEALAASQTATDSRSGAAARPVPRGYAEYLQASRAAEASHEQLRLQVDRRSDRIEAARLDPYAECLLMLAVGGAGGLVVELGTEEWIDSPPPDAVPFIRALQDGGAQDRALGICTWALLSFFVNMSHPDIYAEFMDVAEDAFGRPSTPERRVILAGARPFETDEDQMAFHRTEVAALYESVVAAPVPSSASDALMKRYLEAWGRAIEFMLERRRYHFPHGPPQPA